MLCPINLNLKRVIAHHQGLVAFEIGETVICMKWIVGRNIGWVGSSAGIVYRY